MDKSIIIFGKGPSLLRCTREIVDKFDDIAIINYPVLNPFFNSLIENRTIKYHFANCATYDTRYNDDINKQLNIKGIYNTHCAHEGTNYRNYIKQTHIFQDNIREKGEEYLKKNNFKFDPSSGTLALQYILNINLYNKICVVGFDCFQKNKPTYYYPVKEYNNKIKYLINHKIISENGIFLINSGHNSEKTKKYYEYEIQKNPNIEFLFITNAIFNKFNNLKIL